MSVEGVASVARNKKNNLTFLQERFVTFVRTSMIFSLRLRGEGDEIQKIHIKSQDIERRFFSFPQYRRKEEIQQLVELEEIIVTEVDKRFYYEVTKPGKVDFSLLESKPLPEGPIYKIILNNLKTVSLTPESESTEYFDLYLKYKEARPELFLKVDNFAGRVHTPISNFHRIHRPNLLINGEATTSLDVVTMQPLLLGKILTKFLVDNEYSKWINNGEDIYLMFQHKANLKTRDDAKKKFFEILFSKPSNSLSNLFGSSTWIAWINRYKSTDQPNNPHGKNKPHSNLAWLLQSTEVKIMLKVWNGLASEGIIFLPVHDEVIIPISKADRARQIMNEVFAKEFPYFKISGEKKGLLSPTPPTLPTPILENMAFKANEGGSFKNASTPSTPIIIDPEILDLHTDYTKFEQEGLLDTHPQRSYIGSMWQGVLIYYHKPSTLRSYLDELHAIRATLNNSSNNEK